jgi:hypothetical protein
MKSKVKIILFVFLIAGIAVTYVYFKYFFTYEQSNITKRKIETFTGQNLTITVFGFDGKIVKRWTGVKKITSGKEGRAYTFFYTNENKYVQIPNSVWYLAEEE